MNLDDLISKYLDGELNEKDDNLLRSLIADDKESKDTFYSSVIIHSACREDAGSIVPPADFIQETESKIMMRILAEQPLVEEKLYTDYGKNRRTLFTAALVGFLILGFFRISDFTLQNYKPLLLSMLYEERAKIEKTNYAVSSESNSEKKVTDRIRPARVIQNYSIASVSKSQPRKSIEGRLLTTAQNAVSLPSAVNMPVLIAMTYNPERTETLNSNDNLLAGSSFQSQEIQSGSAPDYNLHLENRNISQKTMYTESLSRMNLPGSHTGLNGSFPANIHNSSFDFYPVKTDIQLGSFFGTDMVRMGLNVNHGDKISHLSQSIGYPINKENIVGIEFGYTQYNYDDKIFVSVPVSTKAVMTSSIEVRNPGDEEGVSLQVPIVLKRDKQIVWGSAYYERNLIDYKAFTLNGRMGVGASSDGMLSFGRLFGKYELFPGFAITLGADARLFRARLVSTNEVSDGWRGTTSLIYGFQLKF